MASVMLMAHQTDGNNLALIDKTRTILKSYSVNVGEEIDGSAEDQIELRKRLMDISERTGVYPQFFKKTGDDDYEFICLGEQVANWKEVEEIVKEQLKADPDFLKRPECSEYKLIE